MQRSVSGGWLALLFLGLLCGCASTAPPPPVPPATIGPPRDGGGITGEGAPPPITAPKDHSHAAADGGGAVGEHSPPRYHGYQLFAQTDAESGGYGMYTYVLSSNLPNATQPGTDDVSNRYDALLSAIGSRTSSAAALSAARTPAEETNLFCIPAKTASATEAPSLQNYNPQLAVVYRLLVERQLASDAVRGSLENHAGPFLVSSLSRLTQAGPGSPVLFADLSSTNPGAMQEVVEVYKRRISRAPLEQAEVFKPFKLALLNIILNGNDYVQIEKVAVAAILQPPAESHP